MKQLGMEYGGRHYGRPTRTIPSSSSVSTPASLPSLRLDATLPSGVADDRSASNSVFVSRVICEILLAGGVGVDTTAGAATSGGLSFDGAAGADISRKAATIWSLVRMTSWFMSALSSPTVGMGGRTERSRSRDQLG